MNAWIDALCFHRTLDLVTPMCRGVGKERRHLGDEVFEER